MYLPHESIVKGKPVPDGIGGNGWQSISFTDSADCMLAQWAKYLGETVDRGFIRDWNLIEREFRQERVG